MYCFFIEEMFQLLLGNSPLDAILPEIFLRVTVYTFCVTHYTTHCWEELLLKVDYNIELLPKNITK